MQPAFDSVDAADTSELVRCDVGRLLALCAYQGLLVYACAGRLRLLAAGPHPFGAVLRARYAELLAHLVANPPPVTVDFETLSAAKLKTVKGRRYARDPTTEVLCAVALLPDGELVTWTPGSPAPQRLFEAAGAAGITAHNAQLFDRWIWETTLGWPAGLLWQDSMEVALLSGYPGSLAELALLLPGASKDAEGSKYVAKLNQKYARAHRRPELSAEDLARTAVYCKSDVLLLARIARGLLHGLWAHEVDVRRAHSIIQRRGFAFDRELGQAVLDVHAHIAKETAVPGVPIRSNQQLHAWLTERGLEVRLGKGGLDSGAIEALLARPDLAPDVRRVLRARLFEVAIGAKKVGTALQEADPDGRIREALRYCGAHTGRWTGVGLQPHNLPRGFEIDGEERTRRAVALAQARDVDGLHGLAAEAGMRVEEVLGALVRPCIFAPKGSVLGVVDYAQIEARVLVWLAGDENGIRAFREGGDVYAQMAARLFGAAKGTVSKQDPRRKLGKVVVLGLGYGMGDKLFRTHAADQGVDWSTVPMSPEQVVEAWRDKNPLIAGSRREGENGRCGGLWQKLNVAAKRVVGAGPGTARTVGRLTFRMQGGDLLCVLPSGRFLRYPEARLERSEERPYATVLFRGRKRRVPGYGGLWTENAVQAIARDLIARALVGLEAAGLPVVLHVHDEVVCELDASRADQDLQRMVALCEELPAWASGIPLEADGFCSPRYRKG